ncbi:hypothetical protein JCM10213_006505 [Rhodosporidiobolus nylandii]
MDSLRASSGVSYTIPQVFLQLEGEFKAEARQKRRSKVERGGRGKKRSNGARPSASEESSDASAADEDVDELASDLEDAAQSDEPEAKKLRKAGASGPGRKKHKDRVSSLPAEVLSQIAAHLTPGGLLALSRTNKALRAFLTSPTAAKLWVAARAVVRLPTLEDGQISEMQYAELAYGTKCTLCGKTGSRLPDCFLRMRLCKPCRTSKLVKLENLSKTHDLHFASAFCVLRTQQTPTQHKKLASTAHWGLLADLERESKSLWKRQERDDNDEEARFAKLFNAKQHNAGGSRSRPHGQSGSEDEDIGDLYSYAVGRQDGAMGKRVEAYVQKRRDVLDALEKDGKTLFDAISKLVANEPHKPVGQEPLPPSQRRLELERRVLALEGGYTEDDFVSPSWLTSKTVNEGADEIDDQAWQDLEPKLLRLLDRSRERASAKTTALAQKERQAALLPFYQQQRNGATFHPLFVDFLPLPSVKALWEPNDAVVDENAWSAALEGIEADVSEWRVSVHLQAVQLILNATADLPEDEQLDPDADAYAAYGDEFLNELGSAVVCSIKGCYRRGKKDELARPTFFGSLFDVFEHQHAEHADLELTAPKKGEKPAEEAVLRVALPLEVANAVDALCDVLDLDAAATEDGAADTAKDVDEVFEAEPNLKVGWYHGKQAKGKAQREWRKVLCHIYREAEKAHKANPPRVFIPALEVKGFSK